MTLSVVFLQAGGGGSLQLILLGGMILVFWLFMIRPKPRRPSWRRSPEDMQKGDKIVDHCRIHGAINKVNEDGTIQIETSPGSYLKIEKSAISMEWTQNLNKSVATTDKK